MGKCRYCEKSGLFLTIDGNGCCEDCGPEVVERATKVARKVNRAQEITSTSKDMETRLEQCDIVAMAAAELLDLEEKGIAGGIEPIPSVLIEKANDGYDLILREGMEWELEKAIERASFVAEADSKINLISEALFVIREWKAHAKSEGLLDDLEERALEEIDKLRT